MKIVKSCDGSYTAFSDAYNQHYHSTTDGAFSETLYKHVKPCIDAKYSSAKLTILDICFGLGFNTLTTLYYLDKLGYEGSVNIISPELDRELVASLVHFSYPKELIPYLHVIKSIASDGVYEDERVKIEVVFGDARAYLNRCDLTFDIVYQDAFSPEENPRLWSSEYFKRLSELMDDKAILSSYSTAFKTRLALYENGFSVYLLKQQLVRDSTLASKALDIAAQKVDMPHKIACNRDVKSIKDTI